MTERYIQVPPDSTGKKSAHVLLVSVPFVNKVSSMPLNSEVLGDSSGSFGVVSKVLIDGNNPSTGVVSILLSSDSESDSFVGGESLLIEGQTVATVDATQVGPNLPTGDSFFYGKGVIAGANNPLNAAFVDNQGALVTRYAEGQPQFDAVGMIRTSTPFPVGEYRFPYGFDPEIWQALHTGSGTQTHLPNEQGLALDVGTAAGDEAKIRTHLYHRYQAGMSQTLEFNVVAGEAVKTGVVREWGYGDDKDGLFFRLAEDGTPSVLIRSSATGIVEETEVFQEDWNGDRADGSEDSRNLSSFQLDPTKRNFYWIDFAWLGAANVRFGLYSRAGARITLHTFRNPQSSSFPFMRTGQLPLQVAIRNTTATSSPSRLKMTCGVVFVDGTRIPDKERVSTLNGFLADKIFGVQTEQPILSIKPNLTFNGVENRKITTLERLSLNITGGAALIRILKNSTLNSPSFTQIPGSSVSVDTNATALTDGKVLVTYALEPGSHNLNNLANFNILGENLKVSADGQSSSSYTISCEADAPVDVRVGLTWLDID